MTNKFLLEAINREFPDAIVSSVDSFGMLTVEIKKNQIKKVIHHMKESTLQIDYLTDLCGVHYPEFPEKELAVVYHLQDMRTNYRVRLKAYSPKKNAEFDSLTELYAGANWMERETFDFYGILFKGHPDLRVILNAEDIGYHPMLKEYPLEDGTRADKDDAMFGR